jgi:hypothetical protein
MIMHRALVVRLVFRGIRLITASQRRNGPACVDSKIHHNNLINNILAKIEGNIAGVDDALMLDPEGFVSETNATVCRDLTSKSYASTCICVGVTWDYHTEHEAQLRFSIFSLR